MTDQRPGWYIGVDVGLSGWVVVLNAVGSFHSACPIPTIKVGKTKRAYDEVGIAKMIVHYGGWSHWVVEKQQSMPKQGVASCFKLGDGFGIWKGVLAASSLRGGVTYEVVHPKTWKAEMTRDIPGDDLKGRAILAASRLFPTVDLRVSERAIKPCPDKAEALLIAEWGRRHLR